MCPSREKSRACYDKYRMIHLNVLILDGDKMSYFAMDLPPGESPLPPTLQTVAGIRGLLLQKTNLEETAGEECEHDVDDVAASRTRLR